MFKLCQTIDDLDHGREALGRRRYGVIEMSAGRLVGVHLRCWPKLASLPEMMLGCHLHAGRSGDRCWLYYNQPLRFPNFLALSYVVSHRDCTLATFHGSLEVLDWIARLKRTDAILCDAWNARISDRLLARWGWESHTPSRWHRNFIKRFYGQYPPTRIAGTQLHESADVAAGLVSC